MSTPPKLERLDLIACCAQAYSHPAAQWLLGDSFHPGGLALTSRLAAAMEIGAGSRVLDVGCGRGASAVHLAKTTGCAVVGLTPEEPGVQAAREAAASAGLGGRATFLQGHATSLDDELTGFDAVIMECVFSILPDKPDTLASLRGRLRPGGRIGMTDITVGGPLPEDLRGVLATVGCVGDAWSLEAYAASVEEAGFAVEQTQDLQGIAASFLRDIRGKLLVAELAVKLGKLPIDVALVEDAKGYVKRAEALVGDGVLSYGLLVASRS